MGPIERKVKDTLVMVGMAEALLMEVEKGPEGDVKKEVQERLCLLGDLREEAARLVAKERQLRGEIR